MIRRLTLTNREATRFEAFRDPFVLPSNEFRFSDGVNVVVGPSGSGKSALLNFIARLLHCSTGFQFVDAKSCELIQHGIPRQTIEGFEFDHTGAAARYYNPLNYKVTRNQGYIPHRHINMLFGSLPQRLDLDNEKRAVLKSYLIGDNTAEKHHAVYLIDSPETGMSIEQIANFCATVGSFGSYLAETGAEPSVQVIIATNHPWIAGLKNANLIETHEGYIAKFAAITRTVSTQLSKQ
jgi:energy-coupling factor transporter ATP-binding protein EcfA2